MRVKTSKGIKFAIIAVAVLLCGLVGIGSQVRVFGQPASSGDAKPIIVDIKNINTAFEMDLLQGSRLFLQVPDTPERFESSPIVVNDNQGSCEFPEPIPPGSYNMQIHIFAISTKVIIHPTPYPSLPLHITIAPGQVLIFSDLVFRNENADIPQLDPIQPDASNPPIIISKAELEYPKNAQWARISGVVKIEVVVNEKGEVYEAKLLAGHPWFQQPALNAVLKWKFQPILVNGEPKPFVTTASIDFHY